MLPQFEEFLLHMQHRPPRRIFDINFGRQRPETKTHPQGPLDIGKMVIQAVRNWLDGGENLRFWGLVWIVRHGKECDCVQAGWLLEKQTEKRGKSAGSTTGTRNPEIAGFHEMHVASAALWDRSPPNHEITPPPPRFHPRLRYLQSRCRRLAPMAGGQPGRPFS